MSTGVSLQQTALLVAVLVPTLGAFLLPFVGRVCVRSRNALAVALVTTSVVACMALLPAVLGGSVPEVRLCHGFVLRADMLAVFMALVSSFISAIIALYSTSYVSHYEYQNEYYLMVVLFLGAMMGLVFSGNLLLLFVFWEITAITSWRLIGFFREKAYVVKADKAFLVTGFGALAMLLGFVILFATRGTFDLALLAKHPAISGGVLCLIMLGILSKSATLPLHTWLPDAGVAPSPVTALLHAAVLVKIGVYVYARLFIVTFHPSVDWQTAVMAVAAASALVSAGAALVDTDMKRIIAYSTVSQIGFIFLGLASGTTVGVAGALLYILMHGLAKGGLFLCAGIVEQNTHTKDIRQMGGLVRSMPLTAGAFLCCALSVMGIPPFGGFFAKYMVISAGIESGQLWITCAFVAGAVMTMLYLFRLFNALFLGEEKMPRVKEGTMLMVACVVLLAALSLVGGLAINVPSGFAMSAARQMLAGIQGVIQ